MLLRLGLVAVTAGGLLAQALWDSSVGAWIAVGGVVAIVLVRFTALVPGLSDLWPFGDGD